MPPLKFQKLFFQEEKNLFPNSASKLANWIIVVFSSIFINTYVITGKLLAEGISIFVDPNELDQ